jgi:hypothetical protein
MLNIALRRFPSKRQLLLCRPTVQATTGPPQKRWCPSPVLTYAPMARRRPSGHVGPRRERDNGFDIQRPRHQLHDDIISASHSCRQSGGANRSRAASVAPQTPSAPTPRWSPLKGPAHRHSLNNQCELESLNVFPGQCTHANAQGRPGLMSTSGNEEKAGEPSSTRMSAFCSAWAGAGHCDLTDHDIPVSIAVPGRSRSAS